MRCAIALVPALAAVMAVLSGCGYAGEPKPPALWRPERVHGLAAEERGSKIVVTFQLPQETTEGLPIERPPDIEMRIGPGPDPWEEAKWVAGAERIPVPAWDPMRPISASPPRAASGSSGAKGSSGAPTAAEKRREARRTVAAAAAVRRDLYSRRIEIDAARFMGKSALIGVKVHGPKGRDDGWSFVTLEVLPPLPVPQNPRAADVRNALHLQWTADALQFRIFRKRSADAEWTQIGESKQPSFDDATAGYGMAWEYSVESVRQVGEKWLESERSETVTFTPRDRFAPDRPTGLTVIAGTSTAELSWNAVTDADLAGYRVYRGGVKIADGVQSAVYSDKDVTVGSRYSYQVSAVDQAGNESERSAAIEITMQ